MLSVTQSSHCFMLLYSRCAVRGGLHYPGGGCHEPLSRGPCPPTQVLALETDTLAARCVDFTDCEGGQVWDGEKCADKECSIKETPSYNLRGDSIYSYI